MSPGFSWLTAVFPRSEQPSAARTPNPRSVKFSPFRTVRPTPSYFTHFTWLWSTPPCSIKSSTSRPTGLSASEVTIAVFIPKHRRSPRATLYSPPPSHTSKRRVVATRTLPGSSRSITSPRLTRSHLHSSFGRNLRLFDSVFFALMRALRVFKVKLHLKLQRCLFCNLGRTAVSHTVTGPLPILAHRVVLKRTGFSPSVEAPKNEKPGASAPGFITPLVSRSRSSAAAGNRSASCPYPGPHWPADRLQSRLAALSPHECACRDS